MLTKRDFYGDEFFVFCCKQYELARVHLKNCGKPKDDYEKFLIREAKWSSVHFKSMINEADWLDA